MKKAHKRILSLAALLLILAIFAWYISSSWPQFQEIRLANPWLLLPAAAFILLNLYATGYLVELAVEPHGVKLSKKEIFGLSALTRFSNNLAPGYLGATVRAVYFKKNYNVSYAKFSSSFMVSSLFQLLISGVVALLIYIYQAKTIAGSTPILIVLAAVVLIVGALYIPMARMTSYLQRISQKRQSKILERLYALSEQYEKVRSHPKLFANMLLWMLASMATSTATLIFLYGMIGFEIGILPALFIAALAGWSIFFSITPSAIGIREGLMALGAQLMGVSVPATLAVALLLRLLTLAVVSALSAYYAPKLLNTTILNIKKLKQ